MTGVHPGVELRANLKSTPHRCHLFEMISVWELTEKPSICPWVASRVVPHIHGRECCFDYERLRPAVSWTCAFREREGEGGRERERERERDIERKIQCV